MVQDGGTGPKPRERAQQAIDQALDVARAPAQAEGARGVLLISLVALILSAISLYETSFKQARLILHVGAVMYYARDAESTDVLAVPVTITNSGARDAVVTALDLRVSPGGQGVAPTPFAGAYVATGANPIPSPRSPALPSPELACWRWRPSLPRPPMPCRAASAPSEVWLAAR